MIDGGEHLKRGDWARLWRSLATSDLMTGSRGERVMVDRWQRLARRLDEGRGDPDPLLDTVLGWIDSGSTVADIGAGVGRWTVPLAERAAAVTAIEPVPEMREVLRARLSARGIGNADVRGTAWMDTELDRHDVVVSVHSAYTSPDLVGFVRKMETVARRRCCLVLRVPAWDGVLGELAERIRGGWHDSPNFIVGFNTLAETGIYPNVIMEAATSRVWLDASLDEAVRRARRHLHIDGDEHDLTIRSVLGERLVPEASGYRWPDGMRSALCWWEPA